MELDASHRQFVMWQRVTLGLAVISLLALVAVAGVVYVGGDKLQIEIAGGVALALLVIGGIVRSFSRWRFERYWAKAGLTPSQIQSKWVTWGGKGG